VAQKRKKENSMTTALVVFILVVALVLWLVANPLLRREKNDFSFVLDDMPDTQKELQLKRSQLMLSIKELDFDYETGKLSKEDYKQMRSKVEMETIDVLKTIDEEKIQWDKFQKELEQKFKKKS
jgi:hypothetical protein